MSDDPVEVLRNITLGGQEATINGNEVVIGGVSFPADTETRCIVNKTNNGTERYRLDQLVMLWRCRDDAVGAYIRACKEQKVKNVAVVDRKELLEYFKGEKDMIDSVVPLESGSTKRSADGEVLAERAPKRSRTESNQSQEGSRGQRGDSSAADNASGGAGGERGRERSDSHGKRLSSSSARRSSAGAPASASQRLKGVQLADATATARIVAGEHTLTTRNSQLLSAGKSFRDVLALCDAAAAREGGGSAAAAGKSKSKVAVPAPVSLPKPSGPPIIVVPNAAMALLTLHNVKKFLQDDIFVPPNEAKAAAAAAARDGESEEQRGRGRIQLRRPLFRRELGEAGANGQRPVLFEVVDSWARFKPNDWDRVVAVFVQGAKWQFKGWRGNSSPAPAEIFSQAMGVYLQYQDQPDNKVVAEWNVRVLKLHRNQRHLDQVCALKFWEDVEEFMRCNHAQFLPSAHASRPGRH